MTSTPKIWVGLEKPRNSRKAYEWHRGFASANPHISLREWDEYKKLANEWRIIAAKDHSENYIGLGYIDLIQSDWVIGGLMTANSHRRSGIGLAITCLALANILVFEKPLPRNERIVAYVANPNSSPLFLVDKLAFRKTGNRHARDLIDLESAATIPSFSDEYEITIPGTLNALSQWFNNWTGNLGDGTPVSLELRGGMLLNKWCQILAAMAYEHDRS